MSMAARTGQLCFESGLIIWKTDSIWKIPLISFQTILTSMWIAPLFMPRWKNWMNFVWWRKRKFLLSNKSAHLSNGHIILSSRTLLMINSCFTYFQQYGPGIKSPENICQHNRRAFYKLSLLDPIATDCGMRKVSTSSLLMFMICSPPYVCF